jgi:6-pyruvoyl-tetrahydropterin synthase
MYTVYVDSFFWASHSVPMPDGKDEPVHSHNFCATAKVTAGKLDDKAMVVDFCRLKQSLDKITSDIAASGNIGRIDYFCQKGQTAEVLAEYVFKTLRSVLPRGISLVAVTVTEEPGCRAEYAQ